VGWNQGKKAVNRTEVRADGTAGRGRDANAPCDTGITRDNITMNTVSALQSGSVAGTSNSRNHSGNGHAILAARLASRQLARYGYGHGGGAVAIVRDSRRVSSRAGRTSRPGTSLMFLASLRLWNTRLSLADLVD
jgi:hypothetical protein